MAAQRSEATFEAADGTTLFRRSWTPSDPPRSIVIVVHGLGEHSGRYDHVAEALTAEGHEVHALDHRGHGRSGGKRVHVRRFDEFVADLERFRTIVARPGLPLVVLGHSMGGAIALDHVLRHGDAVTALALSGPALSTGPEVTPFQMRVFRVIARIAPGLRVRGLPAEAISRDPAVVAAYRADPLVYTGRITAGLGSALLDEMAGFAHRFGDLRLPVLLLHGTADQLADVAGSRALEAAATDAAVTAHYYEGLYHEVFNEPERDRVIADLTSWLGEHV